MFSGGIECSLRTNGSKLTTEALRWCIGQEAATRGVL